MEPLSLDRMCEKLWTLPNVDLVDANLTITVERRRQLDFSAPLRTGVDEIIVTGADLGNIRSFDDLTRHVLLLRRSSSYFVHVAMLNAQRLENGAAPLKVVRVDEILEDVDLLEMIQAGIIDATVVDRHKAELWAQVFDGIRLHPDLVVHGGGETAIALRKKSPELKKALDGFVATVAERTKLGNILDARYLDSTKWITKLSSQRGQAAVERGIALAQRYAPEYGFDWVVIAALAYQESGFDHARQSAAGAVGLMQILPSTASDPNVDIPNISKPEANVHAGVKYLAFLRDRYFSSGEIDDFNRTMFALAAYNAGPANIQSARNLAPKLGLDPDVWFANTEIAVEEIVGTQPTNYVRNIFKYTVDLRLSEELAAARQQVSGSIQP
jgi:membrane-bound lytic murein transglycosylase MltF